MDDCTLYGFFEVWQSYHCCRWGTFVQFLARSRHTSRRDSNACQKKFWQRVCRPSFYFEEIFLLGNRQPPPPPWEGVFSFVCKVEASLAKGLGCLSHKERAVEGFVLALPATEKGIHDRRGTLDTKTETCNK